MTATAAAIDALLPQTQCERCGYKGCAPYAQAIADGVAPINRCPPGGDATIQALADLLGRVPLPLDADLPPFDATRVAVVDEARCIGCALCLPACPVDAIVGAAGYMHTVIRDQCTGCELCIPVCPVDCIELIADPSRVDVACFDPVRSGELRARFDAHTQRATMVERAAESRRQARLAQRATKRAWGDGA